MKNGDCGKYFLGILRLALGFIFLWAFLDKLFGLGFSTSPDKSWLAGGSPTAGYLLHATQGPLMGFFHSIAGSSIVAWLFMLGLLFVGVTLMSGIGVRAGATVGSGMLFLMWLSGLLPATNPFLDKHIIYILALGVICLMNGGDYIGFGKRWAQTKLVENYPILR